MKHDSIIEIRQRAKIISIMEGQPQSRPPSGTHPDSSSSTVANKSPRLNKAGRRTSSVIPEQANSQGTQKSGQRAKKVDRTDSGMMDKRGDETGNVLGRHK
jgi:hypothetical protein